MAVTALAVGPADLAVMAVPEAPAGCWLVPAAEAGWPALAALAAPVAQAALAAREPAAALAVPADRAAARDSTASTVAVAAAASSPTTSATPSGRCKLSKPVVLVASAVPAEIRQRPAESVVTVGPVVMAGTPRASVMAASVAPVDPAVREWPAPMPAPRARPVPTAGGAEPVGKAVRAGLVGAL